MNITCIDYSVEIERIASNLIEENKEEADERGHCVLEFINYNGLDCEAIDWHQWIIYYSYNLDVLDNTDNFDYMQDNLGDDSLVNALKQGGLNGLHQAIAYHAMLADVQDELNKLELG